MMSPADVLRFSASTLSGFRTRTILMIVAMSIGVAAVVVLTALGEGARRYVINQFSSLGTNLIIVFPGRTETSGNLPGMMVGRSPRDLTVEDALALQHSAHVTRIAPLNLGSATISRGRLEREAPIIGTTQAFKEIRNLKIRHGRFLPAGDPTAARSICVIGQNLSDELFGNQQPIGQWLRIGERRFRVIGVLASEGRSLGFDTDEIAIIPVASAQVLFNQPSLLRIFVETRHRDSLEAAQIEIRKIIQDRHEGDEDVTVITQDAVLATFDRILRTLTYAVGGIAAISLGVAGILTMNVMLIAVAQRTSEIGLLKALGASGVQIRNIFFAEAAMLSVIGAVVGLAFGAIGVLVIRQLYPQFPAAAPVWAVVAAVLTASATGVGFSLMPATRAARLDPVVSLARR